MIPLIRKIQKTLATLADACALEARLPLYTENLEDFLTYGSDFIVINPRVLHNQYGELVSSQLLYASPPNPVNPQLSVVRYVQSFHVSIDYLLSGNHRVISELEAFANDVKIKLESVGREVVISKTRMEQIPQKI